ncbi:hypothetical protein LSCM1_00981 [Leishmania martiniquensis]|uniref:Uncharacterized protein n=1 Tax=Leishmania martiniquensis TaxID=1580590 RepID=A0A836K862_9TRYP|nr:hypothetical protein LSCM1_00981 [Leishmania martiniquensis]
MPLSTLSPHNFGRRLCHLGFAGPLQRRFCTHAGLRPHRSPASRQGRRFLKRAGAGAGTGLLKRNLLSPFGHVLQGSSRGPQGFFAEPLEAWLSVLADSVPFYKDCLVICPSTASQVQVQHLWDRCRQHIPSAHIGALSLRRCNTGIADATDAARALLPLPNATSTEPSRLLVPGPPVPHGGGGGHLTSASTPQMPPLYSPLERVPPGSLDIIVLASNVFGHEMLFDSPWHLSLAHRALRPHGVVAIFGHVAEARVAAPEWAATDTTDYIESTHLSARETLQLAASSGFNEAGLDAHNERHLRRAVEVHETLRSGHADVFFPFPSVRRRWLTSEYALHPAQLAAHYRATPLYQTLYGPAGSLWWNKMRFRADALKRQRKAASVAGGDEEDFFVDITEAALDGGLSAGQSAESSLEDLFLTWSPLGVHRRRGVDDPLDALQAILDASAAADNMAAAQPPLRVQLHHFVVTCSVRSINAAPSPEGRTRLPENRFTALGAASSLQAKG